MHISQMNICGFRCFDDEGIKIQCSPFLSFVGPNASGKTAILQALVKMFGETSALRQIKNTDFYVGKNENLRDKNKRNLHIECIFEFPELEREEDCSSIPEVFNQMCYSGPNNKMVCRIRLEAEWTNNGTQEGYIEQKLLWVTKVSDDDEGELSHSVDAHTRGKIRIAYIPSIRNPEQQIHSLTAYGLGQLLKSIQLNVAEESLKNSMESMRNTLNSLSGVMCINEAIQEEWDNLYDGQSLSEVSLQAIDDRPQNLLKLLAPFFYPDEQSKLVDVSELSDGLRSLFSISLVATIQKMYQKISQKPEEQGFDPATADNFPILTIIALEEPENHLSPHYLGKIVNEFIELSSGQTAQVFITSHSPAVLARIPPEQVRYCCGHEKSTRSLVKGLPLPCQRDGTEAAKFVREAVRGYPELYFSRLVVLGEGPSEEIILRKLFDIAGIDLDSNFISVIPLGGRHVNHFWKLLSALKIPYVTLLDLDFGKEHGGWQKLQYVRNQLVKFYPHGGDCLKVTFTDGRVESIADDKYDTFFSEMNDDSPLESWINYFNKFGVFFSSPLDIDFAMLDSFFAHYKSLISTRGGKGPRLPDENDDEYEAAYQERMWQVIDCEEEEKEPLLNFYTSEQQELFPWYKYLFIVGSKPATHMQAMIDIPADNWEESWPTCLIGLVNEVKNKLDE